MTKIEATFHAADLKAELLSQARSIGITPGFAEAIADQVTKDISAWLKGKPTITRRDLDRKIAKSLKKYHPDLAYIYENRGKII